MSNEKTDWKERELGALWKREGKAGPFFSGKLVLKQDMRAGDELSVVAYKNRFKKEDGQPDLIVYVSVDRPQQVQRQAAKRTYQPRYNNNRQVQTNNAAQPQEDPTVL